MNKYTIAALLMCIVLITGCSGVKTGQTKEQAAAAAQTIHTGFKGVSLEFVRNNPPDTTFTGSPLDVVVELKNEGASPAEGTLYLSGYDPRLFNIQPQYKEFSLEARSPFNTFGGYDTAAFNAPNIFLPQGTDTLTQNFLASACYQYRTEARIPVCIDPNPNSVLENEACRVQNPSVGGGQGGPVGITAIQEEAAPGRVNFVMTIANQGDGQVVATSSMGKCPSPLNFNDVDTVQYGVRLSGIAGECKPASSVRLANKQGTLYCTFQLSDDSATAYTALLEVNLDYGYLSQKSKQIRIKNLG
jgi:hypothetical protein